MDSQKETPTQKARITQATLLQIKELQVKQDKTRVALRTLDIGTMLFFVLLANKDHPQIGLGPILLLANAALMTMSYNVAENMFSLPRGAMAIGLLGYWSWKSFAKQ